MADAESLWLSYSDPNEDILSVGSCKEHSLCIQCETLNSIFKFAFMGKFLQLYRFVPTTTTMTLDQPTLLDDLNLNPQPG